MIYKQAIKPPSPLTIILRRKITRGGWYLLVERLFFTPGVNAGNIVGELKMAQDKDGEEIIEQK